jgi:hypothetical protein
MVGQPLSGNIRRTATLFVIRGFPKIPLGLGIIPIGVFYTSQDLRLERYNCYPSIAATARWLLAWK